jgi:hypothetical protein
MNKQDKTFDTQFQFAEKISSTETRHKRQKMRKNKFSKFNQTMNGTKKRRNPCKTQYLLQFNLKTMIKLIFLPQEKLILHSTCLNLNPKQPCKTTWTQKTDNYSTSLLYQDKNLFLILALCPKFQINHRKNAIWISV